MNWFLIGLLAPLLWGITNFIDKYIIDRFYGGGVKIGYMLVSFNAISTLLIPLVYLLAEDINVFSLKEIILLAISGFMYIVALFPYMYALRARDTSLIVPLFQTIPIFSLFLGYLFLNETITFMQFILGMIIILGGIAISLDINRNWRKTKLDLKSFLLMILACFLYALGNLTFKAGAGENEFWSAIFWVHVGYAVQTGLIVVFIAKARTETINLIKEHGGKLVGVSVLNTLLDAGAKIVFSFALFSAPLFLASIVNSFQPVFVFLMGVGLTIFAPKFIKEDLRKKTLLQKIILITLIFAAAVAFNYNLG